MLQKLTFIYLLLAIEKRFVIHFEDGIGNKDSITLLLNWNDNCNNSMWPLPTYPELDEIPITEPFDSIFEVRAVKNDFGGFPSHIKDSQYKTLVICDYEWQDDELDIFPEIYFIPRIKHLPLKMYWDFNWLKQKKQLDATWLTNDYTWFIYDGNIEYITCCLDDENYYNLSICASEYGDTLILDSFFLPLDTLGNALPKAVYVSGQEVVGNNQMPSPYVLEDSLSYNGGKFFPIFFLMQLQQSNYWLDMCNVEVGIVETELPFEVIVSQQKIIIDDAYAPIIKNLSIINLNGKEVMRQQYYNKPLSITNLQKGLYVLLISNKEGQVFSKKFVKL